MTMRSPLLLQPITPGFPLLEASDLPGAEDWSVLESLHFDDSLDRDDDQFATLTVARAFDE